VLICHHSLYTYHHERRMKMEAHEVPMTRYCQSVMRKPQRASAISPTAHSPIHPQNVRHSGVTSSRGSTKFTTNTPGHEEYWEIIYFMGTKCRGLTMIRMFMDTWIWGFKIIHNITRVNKCFVGILILWIALPTKNTKFISNDYKWCYSTSIEFLVHTAETLLV